jgi:hypothetical protein
MKTKYTVTFKTALCAAVAASALGLAQSAGRADEGTDPKVLPPNSHPFGKSYTEWSESHWQWLYSIPAGNHPAFQDGNIDLSQYQPAGKVWFLIGSFSATPVSGGFLATANRTATVPYGKALFFPIIDAEASTAEGNGTTKADLTAAAKSFAEPASNLACEIDGQPVQNVARFHYISPVFTWGPVPADNLLGLPAGTTTRSVSDGYFLMLAPLAPGQHTLHFTGTAGTAPGAFTLDVTYHLTVQPKAPGGDDDDDQN